MCIFILLNQCKFSDDKRKDFHMDKLIFEEKTIGKPQKVIIMMVSILFLAIGMLVIVALGSMSELERYYNSSAVKLYIIFIVICFLEVLYGILSLIAMNKACIKIYEKHVEGVLYMVIYGKNYYINYKDITGIQLNNSVVIIHNNGNEYAIKSKNAQKIYNILMEQKNLNN